MIFSFVFLYLDTYSNKEWNNSTCSRKKKRKRKYSQEENIFILRSLQLCFSSSSIPRTKKILHSSKRLYENYLDVTLIIFLTGYDRIQTQLRSKSSIRLDYRFTAIYNVPLGNLIMKLSTFLSVES